MNVLLIILLSLFPVTALYAGADLRKARAAADAAHRRIYVADGVPSLLAAAALNLMLLPVAAGAHGVYAAAGVILAAVVCACVAVRDRVERKFDGGRQ